jgi:hypothetical protein
LWQALAAFLAVLDGYTLADLVVPDTPLRALLDQDTDEKNSPLQISRG